MALIKTLRYNNDSIFRLVLFSAALLILVICSGIILALVSGSFDAFREYGFFRFIVSDKWNVSNGSELEYGALPFITGTLYTSLLAIAICIPFALSVALFTGEYFRNTTMAKILGNGINMLACVPSVVYGLWGFYTLRPLMINLNISSQGLGIFTSSVVLAVMVIPYAASLSSQYIQLVPDELKECAYSLNATRLEVIKTVILPYSRSGIVSSFMLALGRALGETMAVTMLIGNTNNIPVALSDTGNTMASIIANQFGEADGIKLSSLMAIGLILFIITMIINFIGRKLT